MKKSYISMILVIILSISAINVSALIPSNGWHPVTQIAVSNTNQDEWVGTQTCAANQALRILSSGAPTCINVPAALTCSSCISTFVDEGQPDSITSAMITNGQIVDADISATATIACTKTTCGSAGMTNPMTSVGDLIVGGTLGAPTRFADVAVGNVLISGGVNVAPTYGKVALGTHTTGAYDTTPDTIADDNTITSSEITDGTIVSADVGFNYANSASKGGPASTALALNVDGSNCGAGQVAMGVDASGNAQGCFNPASSGTYTAGDGLSLTSGDFDVLANSVGGTRINGDNVELIDCAPNQILKRNAVDNAWICASDDSGTGSGTVSTGTAGQIAYYASTGTTVAGMTAVPIENGGTGATSAAYARLNLGLKSMATQDSTAVSISGGSIVGIPFMGLGTGNKLLITDSGYSSPDRIQFMIGDGTGWKTHFTKNSGEKLFTFTDTGSLGVGTSSPVQKMDVVNGNVRVSDSNGDDLIIGEGGGGAGRFDIFMNGPASEDQRLLFWGGDSSNNYKMDSFEVGADSIKLDGQVVVTVPSGQAPLVVNSNVLVPNFNADRLDGYTASDFVLAGAQSSGGWADDGTVVRLTTSTDNVGIGTSSPAAKLDVAGQVKISGGSPGVGKVLTSDANGLASWQNTALSPILLNLPTGFLSGAYDASFGDGVYSYVQSFFFYVPQQKNAGMVFYVHHTCMTYAYYQFMMDSSATPFYDSVSVLADGASVSLPNIGSLSSGWHELKFYVKRGTYSCTDRRYGFTRLALYTI